MANLTILYWRDIPSQVIVRSGRNSAKASAAAARLEAEYDAHRLAELAKRGGREG
jgi:hypothetical protein